MEELLMLFSDNLLIPVWKDKDALRVEYMFAENFEEALQRLDIWKADIITLKNWRRNDPACGPRIARCFRRRVLKELRGSCAPATVSDVVEAIIAGKVSISESEIRGQLPVSIKKEIGAAFLKEAEKMTTLPPETILSDMVRFGYITQDDLTKFECKA